MTYRAPVRDLIFTLTEVAGLDAVAATGAFPDYDADLMGAVLEAAGQFSEGVLAPLNRVASLSLQSIGSPDSPSLASLQSRSLLPFVVTVVRSPSLSTSS